MTSRLMVHFPTDIQDDYGYEIFDTFDELVAFFDENNNPACHFRIGYTKDPLMLDYFHYELTKKDRRAWSMVLGHEVLKSLMRKDPDEDRYVAFDPYTQRIVTQAFGHPDLPPDLVPVTSWYKRYLGGLAEHDIIDPSTEEIKDWVISYIKKYGGPEPTRPASDTALLQFNTFHLAPLVEDIYEIQQKHAQNNLRQALERIKPKE